MGPLAKSLLVAAGAACGANARYWLGQWASTRWTLGFPWDTLVINVTGSVLIGMYLASNERQGWDLSWRLLVAVGLAGGYTSFSTFSWETMKLIQAGNWTYAFGNVIGSSVLSVAGCWLGIVTARALSWG